jgi:hypothetical protein
MGMIQPSMHPPFIPPRRLIELRKYRRVMLPPGSLLSFTGLAGPNDIAAGIEGDGTLIDLSQEGCQIASETIITLGNPYTLILQLPSFPAITIESAIARWISTQSLGFKFDAIEKEQEEHLHDLLHQLRATAP